MSETFYREEKEELKDSSRESQERLMDMLAENWEAQERARLVTLPRWAQ